VGHEAGIDEVGFVDADKPVSLEKLFVFFEGFGGKEGLVVDEIETRVIAFGLESYDVLHFHIADFSGACEG